MNVKNEEPKLTHYQKYKKTIYDSVYKNREKTREKRKQEKELKDKIVLEFLEKQLQILKKK